MFSKLQAIFLQEEEMKKEVKEMKHIINTTMKSNLFVYNITTML